MTPPHHLLQPHLLPEVLVQTAAHQVFSTGEQHQRVTQHRRPKHALQLIRDAPLHLRELPDGNEDEKDEGPGNAGAEEPPGLLLDVDLHLLAPPVPARGFHDAQPPALRQSPPYLTHTGRGRRSRSGSLTQQGVRRHGLSTADAAHQNQTQLREGTARTRSPLRRDWNTDGTIIRHWKHLKSICLHSHSSHPGSHHTRELHAAVFAMNPGYLACGVDVVQLTTLKLLKEWRPASADWLWCHKSVRASVVMWQTTEIWHFLESVTHFKKQSDTEKHETEHLELQWCIPEVLAPHLLNICWKRKNILSTFLDF